MLVSVMGLVEVYVRRIGYMPPTWVMNPFDGVARPYFAGSSLILSPQFATGMTQSGVATSAELRSDV